MANNGWHEVRLGDVVDDITVGHVGPMTHEYVPNGVPFLRSTNILPYRISFDDIRYIGVEFHEKLKKSRLSPGDVVIVRTGKPGTATVIPIELADANCSDLVIVRSGNRVNPRFLAFFINGVAAHQVSSHLVGAVQQHFNVESARQLTIALPTRKEQDRIADILGVLDDKIELNRRTNETLESLARALFKSWFIDFDPVHAKAAGHKPVGVDPATAAVFPDHFADSDLGKITKGWKAGSVPDAFEINPTRSLSKGLVAPYLEMSNMPTASMRALAWEDREFGSGMRFINGDALIARITPCLENGKTAYVDFLEDGQVGWGSTEYIVMRSKPPLPTACAYFLARTDDFRAHVIQNMTGTSGRQRAPAECLNKYQFVMPSEQVARRFGELIAPMLSTMKTNDEESASLAAARDALLPKLLNGEISSAYKKVAHHE